MFRIDNYNRKPTFSSFLPGVSGKRGIPTWCYYVNRGQCVCSFGVSDKDHAIMEFNPAHYAYQQTEFTGMRTFIKRNGKYIEAFAGQGERAMLIESNTLAITEEKKDEQIKTEVSYCILPEEPFGGLLRKITVTNTGVPASFELLDGMAAVIPFGVDYGSMKHVATTCKAWMRADSTDKGFPYFHVSVSMSDSADVKKVDGGHFAAAVTSDGCKLTPFVDPELVFGQDSALRNAEGFMDSTLAEMGEKDEVRVNRLPCAFFPCSAELGKNESITIYEIFGKGNSREQIDKLSETFMSPEWFEKKFARAAGLTDGITDVIATKTADPVFDEYCRQTFLDNVLRGGQPVFFGRGENKKVFWLYSRKHGDPERDYNYFTMTPEYYSQGNGNFRDVNQNRRSDVLFYPNVGKEVIKQFYSLIQIDGCNPLLVDKITYCLPNAKEYADLVAPENREEFVSLLTEDYTPGQLAMAAEGWTLAENVTPDSLLDTVIGASLSEIKANFGEGYWCDHWTYNLDLVESYLAVVPEGRKQLMEEKVYPWFESKALIKPRRLRYTVTPNGVRQYNAVDTERKQEVTRKWLEDASGKRVLSSLAEKMFILSAIKFSTLDPSLMGIEMDGGKPGWYDALNGLPGIFGSSMCETAELARMIDYLIDYFKGDAADCDIFEESARFIRVIALAAANYLDGSFSTYSLWNGMNDAREEYIEKTAFGVTGKTERFAGSEILEILTVMRSVITKGIKKAGEYGEVFPTYFYHTVEKYEQNADGVRALEFSVKPLPAFLEGPTRLLKLDIGGEEKKKLYDAVRSGGLYDKKLSMYKVNESLKDLTFEAGRCCAFTPGWLENESVWLHMEYKYLLELLKSGMYEQYADDLKKTAIPFLLPEMYGRSTLENSSFIESSANPDAASHGRGFVARLSGSTAEFVQMWQIMMFGRKPFVYEEGTLRFEPKPFLPAYLIPEDGVVESTLLGQTKVTYRTVGKLNPDLKIRSFEVTMPDGSRKMTSEITGDLALRLRSGGISALDIQY